MNICIIHREIPIDLDICHTKFEMNNLENRLFEKAYSNSLLQGISYNEHKTSENNTNVPLFEHTGDIFGAR